MKKRTLIQAMAGAALISASGLGLALSADGKIEVVITGKLQVQRIPPRSNVGMTAQVEAVKR